MDKKRKLEELTLKKKEEKVEGNIYGKYIIEIPRSQILSLRVSSSVTTKLLCPKQRYLDIGKSTHTYTYHGFKFRSGCILMTYNLSDDSLLTFALYNS